VAGGLYGNTFALEALLDLVAREPGARLVFNGDFNWFDVDAGDFRRVNESVLGHFATRGNVETELAMPAAGAGCGCGYPEWVDDLDVARSNRIQERLRATAAAQPALLARLGALPMHAVARVGDVRVGVVHGDAQSLSGWGYSQEVLATEAGLSAAGDDVEAAGVRVIASSHTCLPVIQCLQARQGEAVLANNGSAGMPNFRGTRYGLVTRISVHRPSAALYGARVDAIHVHAVPVEYDSVAWERRFLEQWPAGSDAYRSYFKRITSGPAYVPGQALRAAQPHAVAHAQ
jgi:predicted phosphodiesterase